MNNPRILLIDDDKNTVERAVVMVRNEFKEPGNLPSNMSQGIK